MNYLVNIGAYILWVSYLQVMQFWTYIMAFAPAMKTKVRLPKTVTTIVLLNFQFPKIFPQSPHRAIKSLNII